MKRVIAAVVLVAVVVLVVAVNASAGKGKGHHSAGHTIAVVEHATTDAVTNGTAGDDVGNILTFGNDIFNAADTQQVAYRSGILYPHRRGRHRRCTWTTFLPSGQITVEGPFSDTGNTVLAITGGTGAYRNARGEMELKYHNPQGTKFDFVFHVIG